jgi:hypothetical protein
MVNWIDAVDLRRAAYNVHLEFPGDWYRDPWGWPEIEWLVETSQDRIFERLKARGAHRPARIDVAKENFGIRPAVVLDPTDRLAYQALVDALSVDLVGDLSPLALGWRLPPELPTAGHYAKQDFQWDHFTSSLKSLSLAHRAALVTDINSCFASIPVERLAERIDARRSNDLSARLISMLQDLGGRVPGRRGLSQRSFASAALANLYLRPLDAILAQYGGGPVGHLPAAAVRWMDDIWLFSDDESFLRKAQIDLQHGMEELGLSMNTAKTAVLVEEEMWSAAQDYEHSAVDQGLVGDSRDIEPLTELVMRIIGDPEQAPRTSVKFATTRIRNHELWDYVSLFESVAHRMPHTSDHLARLFRDAETWSRLDDWYSDYTHSHWAAIDWSIAQLGTMFPTREAVSRRLTNEFADALAQSPPLALTALFAQRLSVWEPELARTAIRAALEREGHPLQRRVLALAAIGANEERDLVRKALAQYEETAVTLAMLDDNGWDVPSKADFTGP